ncbi:cytochrome P450 [Actinoplanes sp. NPDC051470]
MTGIADAHPTGQPREKSDPDPYPNYAWMREHAPVSPVFSPYAAGTTWLVTSYDLVRASLADTRLSNDDRNSSAPPAPFGSGEWDPARGLLDLDRPEHARLRRLVAGAFSPGAVERMRGMVQRIADEAIDSFAGSGAVDLVSSFSLPVPVGIIHEVLGVPASEREAPARCLDLFYRAGMTQPIDVPALTALVDYVKRLADYKRVNPGDDVAAHLIRGFESGDLRDENELHSMILSVLGAGHVTTVQFLGCAVLRLLQHPDQLAAVREGRVSWAAVVNEVLRYDSPVQASAYRYASEDLEIGGVPIAKGDSVLISLAAANRDPERFEQPDEFRADRDARGNVAFGHGTHLCLGAQLARLEGEVALETLFRRLPDLSLDVRPDDVVWAYGPMLRGPRRLPVTFSC